MNTTTKKNVNPVENKRKINPILQGILNVDKYFTEKFCKVVEKYLFGQYYRKYYKMLEYSCHGIPWLVGWLIFIWIIWSPSLFQMQINFFVGLVIDLILVAIIKAFTRRARPSGNRADMMGAVGPDKFSFPSGHVSRAVYITFFFIYLHPVLNFFFRAPLLSWCTSIAFSRVLLKRHYLLDVLGGFVLGLLEAMFISWIWLEKSTCLYIVSYITDERMGDYD